MNYKSKRAKAEIIYYKVIFHVDIPSDKVSWDYETNSLQLNLNSKEVDFLIKP